MFNNFSNILYRWNLFVCVSALSFFASFAKCILSNLFIYTENFIASHKNIENSNLQYKTHPTHLNVFCFCNSMFSNIHLVQNWTFNKHKHFMLMLMAQLTSHIIH